MSQIPLIEEKAHQHVKPLMVAAIKVIEEMYTEFGERAPLKDSRIACAKGVAEIGTIPLFIEECYKCIGALRAFYRFIFRSYPPKAELKEKEIYEIIKIMLIAANIVKTKDIT